MSTTPAKKKRASPSKEMIVLEPSENRGQTKNVLGTVNRGLRLLNPSNKDEGDYIEEAARKTPRHRYQKMRAHQEMAAQVLALGGTQRLAAKYAGVSPRQIKKYYTDPDFRSRIEEHRQMLTSKIRGKIIRELDRRTDQKHIKSMDLLDILRVLDRVTVGGKGVHVQVEGDVNVTNYDRILQQIFASNTGSEGEDFPVYGDSDVPVPGGDSPE